MRRALACDVCGCDCVVSTTYPPQPCDGVACEACLLAAAHEPALERLRRHRYYTGSGPPPTAVLHPGWPL